MVPLRATQTTYQNTFSHIDSNYLPVPVTPVFGFGLSDATTQVPRKNNNIIGNNAQWTRSIVLGARTTHAVAAQAFQFQRATEIIIPPESVSVHRASLAGP